MRPNPRIPLPRLLSAGAIVAALALLGGPAVSVAAAPASPASGPVPPPVAAIGAHGDTSAFAFDSFDATYDLGRTAAKVSTLKVTETLVAEFPDVDQNHGILRDIPTAYAGHPIHLDVTSVTDGEGRARDYETTRISQGDESFLELKIGDPGGIDRYVHGRQTFRIVYTADDVTRYFADTKDDEFYWDANGTGWEQPFGTVSAKVVLRDGLAAALNGKTACYQGAAGSTTPCAISGDGASGFTASAKDLGPRENMTVAIGFAKGTFVPAPFSVFDYVPLGAMIGIGALLASLLVALVVRAIIARPRTGDPVIAQYEPPVGVSAMLAANIVGATKRGMAASIVDLAVRRKLRLVERRTEGWITGEAYGVQQLDDTGLLPDERRVSDALFGGFAAFLPPGIQLAGSPQPVAPAPSGVRWLEKNDTTLGLAVRGIVTQVDAEARATGLRRGRPWGLFAICLVLGVVGLIGLLLAAGSDSDVGSAVGIFGLIAGVLLEVVVLGVVLRTKPLTLEGSKLWDRLEGLKLYIRLAEADRLRMLQSVTGAERVDTTDGTQIVKIYERLLPYAVLFGLENEWAAELSKYYGATPPDWYDGNLGTFTAVGFASSLGSFTTSTASSLSGSSSSSSSGGSGGGGSSGGGGGGGGGGGF
jgi:uncharacterized membrane protein YgcG